MRLFSYFASSSSMYLRICWTDAPLSNLFRDTNLLSEYRVWGSLHMNKKKQKWTGNSLNLEKSKI